MINMQLTDYIISRVLTRSPHTPEEREAVARVIRELAGTAGPAPDHAWQEYNEYGNTCHHPGCPLAEEEH
jgi:hypothetical protein